MTVVSSVSSRPGASARPPKRRSHAPMVIAFSLIGAAAVAAVSYLLWPTWTATGANDPSQLPVIIGNTLFNVPTASVRVGVQRHSGPQDRIDLAFGYPSLTAGVETRHVSAATVDQVPQTIDVIFLSIAAHGGALAPEERARTIYPRYLDGATTAAGDGIILQSFRAASPYANEDLYVATAPALVARCSRDGDTPGMCLSERRIAGADLTFRFPRAWLGDWRKVASAMQRIVDDLYKPRA